MAGVRSRGSIDARDAFRPSAICHSVVPFFFCLDSDEERSGESGDPPLLPIPPFSFEALALEEEAGHSLHVLWYRSCGFPDAGNLASRVPFIHVRTEYYYTSCRNDN